MSVGDFSLAIMLLCALGAVFFWLKTKGPGPADHRLGYAYPAFFCGVGAIVSLLIFITYHIVT